VCASELSVSFEVYRDALTTCGRYDEILHEPNQGIELKRPSQPTARVANCTLVVDSRAIHITIKDAFCEIASSWNRQRGHGDSQDEDHELFAGKAA